MKKLFAILTIAAAMALISCSQYEEPVQPVNDSTMSDQTRSATVNSDYLQITGGVYPSRGRWQARVTVHNPTSSTIDVINIKATFYHAAAFGIFETEEGAVRLAPGAYEEIYLDFTKTPGQLSAGQRCEIIAYALCPTLSKQLVSAPYYATIR